MEELVRRYDVASGEGLDEFEKQIREYRGEYEAAISDVDLLAALNLLKTGVCRPDFPGKETPGGKFAVEIFEQIMEFAKVLQQSGRVQDLEWLHNALLDLIPELLDQGPGTTHIKLLSCMFGSDYGFRPFYKNLKGDRLKQHLNSLKREFHCRTPGLEFKRFKSALLEEMSRLLQFTDETYDDERPFFAELYVFWKSSFLDGGEYVDLYKELASNLNGKFKQSVFWGLDDPEVYRTLLKTLERELCRYNLTKTSSMKIIDTFQSIVEALEKGSRNKHMLPEIYVAVMEFLMNISSKKAGSPIHKIVHRAACFFLDQDNPQIQGHTELFSGLTKMMIQFLDNLEDHSLMKDSVVDFVVDHVLVKSMANSKEHRALTSEFIKSCLRIHQYSTARALSLIMRQVEDTQSWKDHVEDIRIILDLITNIRVPGKDEKEIKKNAGYYEDFCRRTSYLIKKDRNGLQFTETLVEVCLKLINNRNMLLSEGIYHLSLVVQFQGKKHKDLIISTLKNLLPILTDQNYPWAEDCWNHIPKAINNIASSGVLSLNSSRLTASDIQVLCHFVATAMKGRLVDEERNSADTVCFRLFNSVGTTLIKLLDDKEKMQKAILVIRELVSLMSHEHDQVQKLAMNQIGLISKQQALLLAPFMKKIVEYFVETDDMSVLYTIKCVYPFHPKLPEAHFDDIFLLIDSQHRRTVLPLLVEVAKHQPELYTEEKIARVIEEMYQDESSNFYLQVLAPLSVNSPKKMKPFIYKLLEGTRKENFTYIKLYNLPEILKNVAVRGGDKELAESVMTLLEKILKTSSDHTFVYLCLSEMRAIGGTYRPLLEKRKPLITDLKKRSHDQPVIDQCNLILDVLEGRSLQALAEEILDVKEDVVELEYRVTRTEDGLMQVTVEVKQQRKELEGVKDDVKKQGKTLKNLKKSVDDTKVQIQNLDGKTLSNAPLWARDVSKLMNPEDIVDWRMLASRLGYTNDDIKAWAQMSDPCLAMFNEWYTVRKTSEATFAVLTALQEIDRMDAAAIVENAMKMTKNVVEDDSFEYPKPPEVFLSYQWGVQDEVKLLKQHLEMAGFTCWMDIGQMGGGDKLFEKIDKGIRGAKVVLSCVTEKYAKSPNCNREVNLSVGLGKPIIPLLMEKLSWPPPGSMGPVFSEYLFIRFFTRSGEETGDQRFWSAAKFQELLMQLSFNNAKPAGKNISKEYKNWWLPSPEVIKIQKNNDSAPATEKKQVNLETPPEAFDVFISYQWGKQKQINLLYKRLTKLGFTCWMDIYQMGGGDSLYDKIDKGVRGAKIILSCVTGKYAVSANCRREVSLADSLKKPIVPLLLDKMTWPPPGPMSMVFTELLYITFAKDESIQERWEGDKFEELKDKILEYVKIELVNKISKTKTEEQETKDPPKKDISVSSARTPATLAAPAPPAEPQKSTSSTPSTQLTNPAKPPAVTASGQLATLQVDPYGLNQSQSLPQQQQRHDQPQQHHQFQQHYQQPQQHYQQPQYYQQQQQPQYYQQRQQPQYYHTQTQNPPQQSSSCTLL